MRCLTYLSILSLLGLNGVVAGAAADFPANGVCIPLLVSVNGTSVSLTRPSEIPKVFSKPDGMSDPNANARLELDVEGKQGPLAITLLGQQFQDSVGNAGTDLCQVNFAGNDLLTFNQLIGNLNNNQPAVLQFPANRQHQVRSAHLMLWYNKSPKGLPVHDGDDTELLDAAPGQAQAGGGMELKLTRQPVLTKLGKIVRNNESFGRLELKVEHPEDIDHVEIYQKTATRLDGSPIGAPYVVEFTQSLNAPIPLPRVVDDLNGNGLTLIVVAKPGKQVSVQGALFSIWVWATADLRGLGGGHYSVDGLQPISDDDFIDIDGLPDGVITITRNGVTRTIKDKAPRRLSTTKGKPEESITKLLAHSSPDDVLIIDPAPKDSIKIIVNPP